MGVDARPAVRGRLAAVVETGPDEAARQPWARPEEADPLLGGVRPGLRDVVVGAHVAARLVVDVDAARAHRAALLAADVGLLRMRRVVGIHVFRSDVVTPSAHLDDCVDTAEIVSDRGVAGDGARRVELLHQFLHRGGDAAAGRYALHREFLVPQRPDRHARVVAVAEHQLLEPLQMQGIAAHHPVLVHDQHAKMVAGLEQLRGRRVVGGAIGVRAHFLQLGDAEILQPVGQRRAHAGVILVIACSLEEVGLAVEEETLLRVESERADAELRLLAIHGPSAALHRGDEPVKPRRLRRPKLGRGDLRGLRHLEFGAAAHLRSLVRGRDCLAAGRQNFPLHLRVRGGFLRIGQQGLQMDLGRAGRDIVLEPAVNEHAVGRDHQRPRLHQPDMPVDSRALIEPALGLRGVHPDGDEIFSAAVGDVGDVVAEAAVAAFVMTDEPAVDEHGAVAERAVELQPEPPAGICRRQFKRLPVPADAVLRESFPQRFRAMRGVALRVERQFDGPVVWQVDPPPARVAVHRAGRADARAGLGQVLADPPLVAEVEPPAEIHQEAFTRSGGGGCGGRKEAHREHENEGEDAALVAFHGRERVDRCFAGWAWLRRRARGRSPLGWTGRTWLCALAWRSNRK